MDTGRAKSVLKGTYWSAFIVSLVILMVGGSNRSSSGSSSSSNYSVDSLEVAMGLILIVVIIGISAILLRILLGYVLEVGGRKYFIQASAEDDINMSYLGFGFKNNAYGKIVVTMFLKGLYIFLWTLLLIIPGIIKGYAYRMVPYILADNPNIGTKRAIEISSNMTDGEKWNIFVLDLSFIGWYILGTLALLVGTLFVRPYEDTTNAELYLVLRKKVLRMGYATHSELNLKEEEKTDDDWESIFE